MIKRLPENVSGSLLVAHKPLHSNIYNASLINDSDVGYSQNGDHDYLCYHISCLIYVKPYKPVHRA